MMNWLGCTGTGARVAALALGLACTGALTSAYAGGQNTFESYSDAKDVFWDELYPDGFEEFYCGKQVPGRRHHNIEHTFPAFWMTKARGCGSRKNCRKNDATFNHMEADLHNLYPSRYDVNSARGSLPFGTISGERHAFSGCDFEVNTRIVEPRDDVRGDIARAVQYMASAYDAESGMPNGQLKLMQDWDQLDPPTVAEFARNDKIKALQGNGNPFVEAHPRPAGGQPAAAPVTAAAAAPALSRDEIVRVMTWNIANLHFETNKPLPGRPNAPQRSDQDFQRIARIITDLDPDIIALQEVNGPKAVERILPASNWDVYVSDRFEEDTNQGRNTDHIYTAVAVKKGGSATFIAGNTVHEISVMHGTGSDARPTRRGSEVLVELPNGEPLQLMSIHLKSRCHSGSLESPRSEDCRTLAAQREPLEFWIDSLTDENTPFIVAGDWNRRMDRTTGVDHIWEAIDDGDPAPLDLTRFPEGIDSPCMSGTLDHRRRPIDFIVFDEQVAAWTDLSSGRIVDLSDADKPHRKQISDHCPVVLDLVFPISDTQ